MSQSYAVLEVSSDSYKEIKQLLTDAGYQHTFMNDGCIDLHGIAIKSLKEEKVKS